MSTVQNSKEGSWRWWWIIWGKIRRKTWWCLLLRNTSFTSERRIWCIAFTVKPVLYSAEAVRTRMESTPKPSWYKLSRKHNRMASGCRWSNASARDGAWRKVAPARCCIVETLTTGTTDVHFHWFYWSLGEHINTGDVSVSGKDICDGRGKRKAKFSKCPFNRAES